MQTVPTAANAAYYAEIVHERAVLRRLVEAGTRITQMGYAADDDVGDGVLGQQHAAQHGLLRLQVLGRDSLEGRASAVPHAPVRTAVVLLVPASAVIARTTGGGQTITGTAVGPRVVQGLGNAHRATSSRPPERISPCHSVLRHDTDK